MNVHNHLVGAVADVLGLLNAADLPPLRRRDLVSASRRVCELAGRSTTSVKLEVFELRAMLATIKPAAHGIKPKTYANVRSLFVTAMELAGITEPIVRGAARQDPVWASLIASIAHDKRLSTSLAAFLNWCSQNGIKPAEVVDETVQSFFSWLEGRTLHPRPKHVVWNVPKAWNDAAKLVPGWPDRLLQRISFRAPSRNLRWAELPPSLSAEANSYLEMRRAPNIFETDPYHPKRPLAESTLRQQGEHIRLSASVLLRNGVAIDRLTGLADLVEIGHFKSVLGHYYRQAGGKPNAFAIALSATLIDVARYYVKLPQVQIEALRGTARKLPGIPLELTAKNKALLAQLESDRMKGRLLFLPEELIRKTVSALKEGRLLFVEAQVAVAVDIALVAPLRPQNLIKLNFDRHFREPNGPKGSMVLYIPKHETKSGKRDLTFELPPETAHNIRWYRREILPRLSADPNGDLFVTRSGKRKNQETLAQQLTETVEEKVGVHMTPHQFRHFAAYHYLEAHPEDFQTVSDLLGHSFAKTTLVYAGSSSRRAGRAYGRHIQEQREALRIKRRAKRGDRT